MRAQYHTQDSAAYPKADGSGYHVIQRTPGSGYDFQHADTLEQAKIMCDAWQAWRTSCEQRTS